MYPLPPRHTLIFPITIIHTPQQRKRFQFSDVRENRKIGQSSLEILTSHCPARLHKIQRRLDSFAYKARITVNVPNHLPVARLCISNTGLSCFFWITHSSGGVGALLLLALVARESSVNFFLFEFFEVYMLRVLNKSIQTVTKLAEFVLRV